MRSLYEVMGFDVLAWESGLCDCGLFNRALRAGEDPVQAAGKGVYGIWHCSEQVQPLFHYLSASRMERSYPGPAGKRAP